MIDTILKIKEWETPATLYPKSEIGTARIVHTYYKRGYYHNYGLKGYEYINVTKKIPITCLELKDDKGKWKTWMVDDPPHYWSMQKYAENSIGKVLVAGLGLGLVTRELMNNKYIYSTTVIEINNDVISLIYPLLPEEDKFKVNIINDDFYKFIEETKQSFDKIIIDLWVTSSEEETMKKLVEEVIPLANRIKKRFSKASVVFHGFGISW